jgi:hypothetical protein
MTHARKLGTPIRTHAYSQQRVAAGSSRGGVPGVKGAVVRSVHTRRPPHRTAGGGVHTKI